MVGNGYDTFETSAPTNNPESNRVGLESMNPLSFEGLLYRVRYSVSDVVGDRLEGEEFRAAAEHGIQQRIKFSGPLSSRPGVALEPAGRLVSAVVEIGNSTLDDINKDDLDAALDQAVEAEIDGTRGVPDFAEWEARCRAEALR